MTFQYQRNYRDKLKALALDWSSALGIMYSELVNDTSQHMGKQSPHLA